MYTPSRPAAIVRIALALGGLAGGPWGCRQNQAAKDSSQDSQPAEDWSRDIQTTELRVDVSDRSASATVQVAAQDGASSLSLEAQGLEIDTIVDADGDEIDWSRDTQDQSIDLSLPEGVSTVVIDYTYPEMGYSFDGYMVSGDTFLWPDFCGNLFPCHSDPADGLRFSVDVSGLDEGETAVVAQTLLPFDAPAYMLGFAVGDYTRNDLGTTAAGTDVVFYSAATDDPASVAYGTASFKDYVDTLEGLFGPYPFGTEMGAKSVQWCAEGDCEYAGMEEHPYFDVSDGSVYDPTVYSHETAHAWFGDGIRLGCWGEDLILSEGSASYLEVAIIGLVDGESAAQADIDYFKAWLADSRAAGDDHVVWPESCDAVETYDIWYDVTYSRGALFWLDVEDEVGRTALLNAFADFVGAYLGQTTSMGDLLDTVSASTGFDPWPLAEIWLRSTDLPDGYVLPEPGSMARRQHSLRR